MFSYTKYRLVKALHESPIAYTPSRPDKEYWDEWDNNVGECKSWFFGICRYKEQGQTLPCFGCMYTH